MALYNGMVLKRGKCMIEMIANELKLHSWQVEHTLSLLEEGNTVPFIARYRKEMTGGLDEEQIRKIEELKENTLRLEKRREDVLRLLKEQGVLDEGLNKAILACEKISQIDDLYRPYQQKKKTRAMLAKEAGLEPLAEWIRKFYRDADIQKEAQKYVKGAISSIDEAIQGAKDILAQWIAEDVEIRAKVKDNIVNFGRLETKKKKDAEDEKKVYQMYYEFSERVNRLAPHRIMAIDRGEKENIISVSFSYNKEYLSGWVARYLMRNRKSPLEALVQEAIEDGLKRLVYTAIEREVRRDLSAVAQEKSIQVFSMNLEHLLLQPPLKNKVILGFDPAYRTGCKLAVIDTTGKLLKVDVIYPHVPHKKVKEASEKLLSLIENYHVEVIAIGNGTASRESESFVADFVHKHDLNVSYTIVSEAGASVYSASKAAKEEFADLPVEHRSAVSIARRLQDPLSELIKIDPQSIGVGQYQHDVAGAQLKERLDFVVEKAVNRVGVNVNTASVELLKHVAGLKESSAKSIVFYRQEHGELKNRKELKDISKIGAKTFEQAAGFLRIEDGEELLDRTAIHPESYKLARELFSYVGLKESQIGSEEMKETLRCVDKEKLCEDLSCDMYTLDDILEVFQHPFRDYRERFTPVLLRKDVVELEDLKIGDRLEGVVRNVVDFGAFVDIGLHEDGLVHISQMSENRIGHPEEVVSVGDIVKVKVIGIDMEKQKVQLSFKGV